MDRGNELQQALDATTIGCQDDRGGCTEISVKTEELLDLFMLEMGVIRRGTRADCHLGEMLGAVVELCRGLVPQKAG